MYRAVDQRGQVIDVFVSKRRDIASARQFFTTALAAHPAPAEVITDRAPSLANVIQELIPAAFHNTGQYENNRCECDHGRLKARLRPMRGLKTDRTASVVIRGHAFIQNLRRGHYELGVETAPVFRLATAFGEVQLAIRRIPAKPTIPHALRTPNATPPFIPPPSPNPGDPSTQQRRSNAPRRLVRITVRDQRSPQDICLAFAGEFIAVTVQVVRSVTSTIARVTAPNASSVVRSHPAASTFFFRLGS